MLYPVEKILERTRFLIEEKSYDQAKQLLQILLEKNHEHPEIYYLLGSIFLFEKNFKKAIFLFQKTLSKDPFHSEACLSLSVLFNDLGFYKESELFFQKLKDKQKTNTNNNIESDSFLQKKNPEKNEGEGFINYRARIESLKELLRKTPEDYESRITLADLYYLTGSEVHAVREWSKVLSQKPLDSKALECLRKHRNKIRKKQLSQEML